jgi:hypothetical protein
MGNKFLHFSDFYAFLRKTEARKWKTSFIRSVVGFGRAANGMISLLSLPLNIFAKSISCPSADRLLAFSKSLLSPAQLQLIVGHLEECDFCRAELHLLERFPCRPEVIAVAEMPASLRAFAESILGNAQTMRSLERPCPVSH